MRLDEKYRPKSFDEVLGQEKACRVVQGMLNNGIGGRALWISGKSGTGKSSIARIVAATVADPMDVWEVVGREVTLTMLGELRVKWSYVPIKTCHVLIVNESHGLCRPVIEKLLDILERLPNRVCIIFTTTKQGQDLFDDQPDSSPFGSRCYKIGLSEKGLAPLFARRLREIAQAEGLDGKPESAYLNLVNETRANMRECLLEIEAGRMLG
jgi:hypothetical protein